jgi:hypothetical protein
VELTISRASELRSLPHRSLLIAFARNLFEHLPSKRQLFEVLSEIHRASEGVGSYSSPSRTSSTPNREYWNFIDHYIPLTENSLARLDQQWLQDQRVYTSVLPFSVSSSTSKFSELVSLYLKKPPVSRFFGRQTSMVGVKL